MAHEILRANKKHSYKVDIWSTGVILFEMLVRRVPFPGRSEYAVI